MRLSKVTKAYAQNEIDKLTQKEKQIVLACYKNRMLSRSQIECLFFEPNKHHHSNSYARKALRRLYNKRFLDRLQRRIGGERGGSNETVYCLDEAGAYLIARMMQCNKKDIRWRKRQKLVSDLFACHTLSINDFMTKLYIYGKRHPPQKLIEFKHDYDCHINFYYLGEKIKLKPDGFGIYFDGEEYEIYFFLEIDLGTMVPELFKQKIEKYVSFWLSGLWKEEYEVFPKLLVVTVDERRLSVLKKATEQAAIKSFGDEQMKEAIEFSFTTTERIKKDSIGGKIWQRAFSKQVYSLFD